MDTEQYIGKLDFPLNEIAKELRRIITTFSSVIREEMKWNVPTYSINKNICAIIAHNNHVNFQIFRGAHMLDSLELEGTGKNMRHLKLSTLSEVEETKLVKYLEQAIELDQ